MTGTVVWPTLGNAKTKLRGTIEGNSYVWVIYFINLLFFFLISQNESLIMFDYF